MLLKSRGWLLAATLAIAAFLFFPSAASMRAQVQEEAQEQDQEQEGLADHSECGFFGAGREKYNKELRDRYWRSRLAEQVTNARPASYLIPNGSRTSVLRDQAAMSTIDVHIFGELQRRGIAPAQKTTDQEFVRRVTLDLTGRIPSYARLQQLQAIDSASKRADYVEELLNSPEWVDKWTMYFGDLYKNTQNTDVTPRFAAGRNAFYRWIKSSLGTNKPYNAMVSELLAGDGENSFEQGYLNWMIGSDTNGGPVQDDYDQIAADAVSTFLGIGHLNCVLCHNGRGHLDTLSLWGRNAKRSEAWGMSAYFSRVSFRATRTNPTVDPNMRYYAILDNGRVDYSLNTATGNRPPRAPVDGLGNTVRPVYMFGDERAAPGENYRDAFARALTNDFQFARATVNYVWAQFMGRGLVEPLDQFDPARQDPANPPGLNWSLQASHPELLNALADQFRQNGYNLKWLMRTIVNSEAYQLSSKYEGEWNPTWEPYFARHLVRRLWAEEIADAISTSSGVRSVYNVPEPTAPFYTDRTSQRQVLFAMQLPETGTLGGTFLYNFSRGNRLDEERKGDGSIPQALGLMNDTFVMTRIRSTNNANGQSFLNKWIGASDTSFVTAAFQTILSREPSPQELEMAVNTLRGATGNTRTQRGENLLWTLYNKVDFIYNY